MKPPSRHSPRRGIRLLALGLSITLAACGSPITTESDALILTFTQQDSLGQVTAELGTYSVAPAPPASLQGALKAEVSIEGYDGSFAAGRVGGDPGREVIMFFLVIGPEGAGGYIQATAFRPVVTSGPVETPPSGVVPELPVLGTLHAFFIAGIGDPPDGPVEIVLRGTSATQRLVIDSTNTLPLAPAFGLNETQVAMNPDTGSGRRLGLEFSSRTEGASHGSLPWYVWTTRNGVAAGIAGAGHGTGIGLPNPAAFDFRLFFIAP